MTGKPTPSPSWKPTSTTSTPRFSVVSSRQALAAGALDVFHTPIQMKKNRPGVLLTILCAEADADKFTELLLRETSAFGVRRYPPSGASCAANSSRCKRLMARSRSSLAGSMAAWCRPRPEFESCKKLAEQAKVPLKHIYEAAAKAIKLT